MRLDRMYLHDARRLTEIVSPTEPIADVVITSPPYYNLKNYDAADQIGYGQNKDQYLADVETVLRNCFTVTKPLGSLWLVIDDYREDGILQLLPWEICQRATHAGWKLRDQIIWDKQHTIPWASKGHMRKVFEFIFFFTKSDNYKYKIDRVKILDEVSKWWVDFPERFNPKGKTPTNIWQIPIRRQGTWPLPSKVDHHCPFPTALVARIIELTTNPGDVVLDPFAGSGVALAQAAAMKRNFIGFEINNKYVKMFERVVKDEVAKEWREMKEWRQLHKKTQDKFEQTVMKLRALKYARQVSSPFLSEHANNIRKGSKGILCVTSIPPHFRRDKALDVSVWIIVDKRVTKHKRALKEALNLTTHPPLSQFGISSEVKLVTTATLRKKTDMLDRRFYLYPAYRPRKYVASFTLRRWLSENNGDITADAKVPLLANIAVDVAYALKD